jgi:hypothetical protein
MRRLAAFLVIGLTILGQTALAEQTWHGFRFGMTLAEVKAKVHLTKDEQDDQGVWYRGPTILIQSLPFTERFIFGPRLKRITLTYDAMTLKSDQRPYTVLTDHFVSDLSAKYGRPVEQHGACTPEEQKDPMAASCHYTWSHQDQAIGLTMYRAYDRISLLVISYAPADSQL